MDLDPRESGKCEYPYSDYYSTGGRYRPPKQPRNYGWMVAILGVFLLCVAGGVAMSRGYGGARERSAAATMIAADAPESSEASEAPGNPEEGAAAAETKTSIPLRDGVQMQISEDSDETMSLPEIYKQVIPSVASITSLSGSAKSTGTGIVMTRDGYIITNYHVVSGAQSLSVLLTSGEEYEAEMVGGDETSDLAVLKIDAENLDPAEFGSSDTVEVGDSVVAIGDPLGTELRGTMTDGIICGIQRDVHVGDRTMNLMQTNAALNSGNSGGPLVNMAGQVIGINTMKISSQYAPVEGIGFAIPISAACPIVEELVEKGYVSGRPAFGFTLEVLSTQMRLFYNLPGCLYIRQVAESSDAYAQGVRAGDVIVAIEGTAVGGIDEFNTIKNQFSAGDSVTLTIFRKGEEMDVEVVLMDRADMN